MKSNVDNDYSSREYHRMLSEISSSSFREDRERQKPNKRCIFYYCRCKIVNETKSMGKGCYNNFGKSIPKTDR